ncbi:MAG: pyridoxal phosphate-dependent decarboxylase family protein [Planctomycetota bacterium]|jgi:aromatic-L-amino-acid decarboxylase
MDATDHDLEFTPDQMRAMSHDAVERIVAHIASLPEQPARGDVDVEDACRAMRERAPETGSELDALLTPFFEEWVGNSFTTPGPGYLAYIPGGGVFPAALADLIANATNRYVGVWQAAPQLAQIEANVLDWFRDWMGFPESTRGLLTTGGSMANFGAIVCAREKLLGTELRDGVIYASTETHHCVAKAAKLAGVLPDRVRVLPTDEHFGMSMPALREAIAADRAAGLRPFLVASTAGTTNTGAVDPLDAIADVCAEDGLWHHCDGAYGAFFHMVPELRPLLAGMSRADSLALDPHKGLFLPYGTGALLVRDGQVLHEAHEVKADYLPDAPDVGEFYDISQYGPELSRDFRGFRVWLTIKLYGAARLRAAVAEKRALAVDAAERVARLPGVVMVAPPQLSLFAWHLAWEGSTLEQQNAATTELMERVIRRGRVMITGCKVDGRVLARVCVLCFRTHADRMDLGIEDITAEAAALIAEAQAG